MDCRLTQSALVPFHFGEVDPEERRAVEAHLTGCPGCLTDYLGLKRDLETGAGSPAPSSEARERLRRAVAVEIGASPRRRAWGWWERPLAAAFAASALVSALFFVHVIASTPGSAPRMLEGSTRAETPAPP